MQFISSIRSRYFRESRTKCNFSRYTVTIGGTTLAIRRLQAMGMLKTTNQLAAKGKTLAAQGKTSAKLTWDKLAKKRKWTSGTFFTVKQLLGTNFTRIVAHWREAVPFMDGFSCRSFSYHHNNFKLSCEQAYKDSCPFLAISSLFFS